MWFVIILALAVLAACFVGSGKKKSFGPLGVLFAIVCFPLWVIMALIKDYK